MKIFARGFCRGGMEIFQIKIPDKALIGVKAISGIGWL
jgi:hypothetical protein